MKRFYSLLLSLALVLIFSGSVLAEPAATTTTKAGTTTTGTTTGGTTSAAPKVAVPKAAAPAAKPVAKPCQKSVLLSGECIENKTFNQYLLALINRIMPLILFLAVIMVAISGVQYMLGGVTKDGTSKAKQRITGSIIGVIFFLLITLILRLVAPNITLISSTRTPTDSTIIVTL